MSGFTQIPNDRILLRTEYFFLIYDGFPVSPGHILIISNDPKIDFFDLSATEQEALPTVILEAKKIIETDHEPAGYNIGMNCGEAAGQTIMHFHCHVIPRYLKDMQDPRGGVRHCVEGKGYYYSSHNQ